MHCDKCWAEECICENCDHILGVIDNERGYDFIKKETDLSWKLYELFDFCPKCGFKLSK